jgi:hypothetical protein
MCKKPESIKEPMPKPIEKAPEPAFKLDDLIDLSSLKLSENSSVYKILFDSKDRLWLLTYQEGIWRHDFTSKTWTKIGYPKITIKNPTPAFFAEEALFDDEDNLILTELTGYSNNIFKYDGQNWTTDTVDAKMLKAITFDKTDKVLWLCTEKGIFELTKNKRVLHTDEELKNSKGLFLLTDIETDKNGHVWVGSDNFISTYSGTEWKKIDINRLSNSTTVNMNVKVDLKNQIWTGVANECRAFDRVSITKNLKDSLYNRDFNYRELFINPLTGNLFLKGVYNKLIYVKPDENIFIELNHTNTNFMTQINDDYSIAFDSKGNAWYANHRTIGRLPLPLK